MPEYIVCAYVRVQADTPALAREWAEEDLSPLNASLGISGQPLPSWNVAPLHTIVDAADLPDPEQIPLWRGD